MHIKWPRNLELLRFSQNDPWILDQAGVLLLGATGSGKTSGPFNTIVRSLLRARCGELFLVAKADATAEYLRIARDENRAADVIVVRPDIPGQGFNILQYEIAKSGADKAIVENIIALLMQAVEIASRRHAHHGDAFFEDAMKALLRHCLFIVITATGKADLSLVLEIVQTLPQSLNDLEEPERLRSLQLLQGAEQRVTAERRAEFSLARKYIEHEWPSLADRTRSSIAITLSVLLDTFLRYPLRDMFLGELTVSPDDVLAGKILIIDVPVKTFDLVGKIAGVLWKYSVQRAIERRSELITGKPIETMRPVCIFADECAYWTTSTDSAFQMTARSARGVSIYATQSIPNFYAEMGGDGTARARVDSLLANLQTRIACQNLDVTTNEWFSQSIGKVLIKRQSHSVVANGFLETFLAENGALKKPVNISTSEQLEYDLPPRMFVGLKRGGTPNKGIVEAIVVTAGDRFNANGKRWLLARFNQFSEPQGWRRFISREV